MCSHYRISQICVKILCVNLVNRCTASFWGSKKEPGAKNLGAKFELERADRLSNIFDSDEEKEANYSLSKHLVPQIAISISVSPVVFQKISYFIER